MAATAETLVKTVEILLVEDNQTDVYFIREALKRSKYSIRLEVVYDGEKALAYLRHQGPFLQSTSPELVLLDLNLPKMNGWEVLTEIKRDPLLSRTPVLVVTTSGTVTDAIRARQLRADFYIVKPLNMIEFPMLIKAVDRILNGITPEN
jgi:chemotaxis family two-component system response regulator Rcp1